MPEFLNNAQYNFQTTGCTIRASRQTPVATRSDNARYIAQLCDEMSVMAMSANLNFLAYLLTMAQAEAQYAIDRDA